MDTLKLAKCWRKYTAKIYNTPTSVASGLVDFSAMQTQSASVVGAVLSLVIILIIGGSALGFTILILKIKKLKSMLEKQ